MYTHTHTHGGRETDDDDTLERHADTHKLTRHTASWAATHPEWAYTSLRATHVPAALDEDSPADGIPSPALPAQVS